jgi:hypothetical protein
MRSTLLAMLTLRAVRGFAVGLADGLTAASRCCEDAVETAGRVSQRLDPMPSRPERLHVCCEKVFKFLNWSFGFVNAEATSSASAASAASQRF